MVISSARPAAATALGAAALLFVLSGCGGASKSPGVASVGSAKAGATVSASAAATDRTGQLLQFASCMRQHGVNVADPQAGAQNVQLPAGTKGDASTQQALQTCQHYLGAGSKDGTDPAAQARAVALARCLRQHGVNVADPQPGQPLQISGAGNAKAEQAALECRAAATASGSPSTAG
ncbi:hypothetical protein [Phaeacidiphilus oryzae]|uniref:hypothetical protein n=1 Tax=Phaeacidiphilus oryzae TaxID=348818 RepID=UPI000A6A271A|nr:hypothetical protein [Phaeacidiphilus oryzae]